MPDDKEKPETEKNESADAKKADTDESKASAKAKPSDDADDKKAASDADESDGGEGEGEDDDDAVRVDKLAKRVEALGGDDEVEALARQEEEKLAERRARLKKKGKKKGLEASASKKLSKIGEKAMPKSDVATAVDAGDPLLNQTAQLSKWIKKNAKQVQYVVMAAVVGVAGWAGWTYYAQRKDEQASTLLAGAVADDRGKVSSADDADDEEDKPKPLYPVFKSGDEKRDSALKKYRDVQKQFPGSGAAYLSRLAEGSLLLDKRDADGAAAAFRDVIASPLAKTDQEVKGRALEGLGFAYELKGSQDDALKTFKELENTVDVRGFKELGMYHQARVLEAKGEKDQAKDLLKTLLERINKPGEPHSFPYLQEVADDRLRAIDPTAAPPKPQMGMGGRGGHGAGGAGGLNMDDPQIKELIEKLRKQAEQGGGQK